MEVAGIKGKGPREGLEKVEWRWRVTGWMRDRTWENYVKFS